MTGRVPSQAVEGLLYLLAAFGPLAFGGVEPWSLATLEIMAFMLALLCWLRGGREAPGPAGWAWLFPASFAAFGLLQLMSPVLPDGPRPLLPSTAAEGATQAAVLLWAAYAAVLWSVPRVLATHEAARRCARFLLWLGAALSAQGLLQAAFWNGRLYWYRPTTIATVFGPYYNKDNAANLLLMTVLVGGGVWFSQRKDWPAVDGAPRDYVRSQFRLGAVVALAAAGLIACTSRGAFLALVMAGAFAAFLRAGRAARARDRAAGAAAALGAGALALFFVYKTVGTAADAGGVVDRSISLRLTIYHDALAWLRDAPLFGTGLGSFETVYPSYEGLDLRALARHAHSDWLELALEGGLVAALASASAVLLLAAHAARLWATARSREMRALIGGAAAAATAFVFHAAVDFPLQIPGNAFVFCLVVGFLLSAGQWKDKAARREVPAPPSVSAAACAVAAFVLLAWAVAGGWRAPDPTGDRAAGSRLYAAATEPLDAAALRGVLAPSLRAADLRPFDYRALSLAGATLARLGRSADGAELLERSRRVRFTPLVVGEGDDQSAEKRKNLATLKAIGLLPARVER